MSDPIIYAGTIATCKNCQYVYSFTTTRRYSSLLNYHYHWGCPRGRTNGPYTYGVFTLTAPYYVISKVWKQLHAENK